MKVAESHALAVRLMDILTLSHGLTTRIKLFTDFTRFSLFLTKPVFFYLVLCQIRGFSNIR